MQPFAALVLTNRLESYTKPSNVAANEADARSRIRDADFEESANLSQQSYSAGSCFPCWIKKLMHRPQLGLSL